MSHKLLNIFKTLDVICCNTLENNMSIYTNNETFRFVATLMFGIFLVLLEIASGVFM